MSEFEPGQAVTWNETGKRLFGDTKTVGIIMAVTDTTARVLWESGQETEPTLNVLALTDEPHTPVPASPTGKAEGVISCEVCGGAVWLAGFKGRDAVWVHATEPINNEKEQS
jgi:hypothetical protein